MPYRGGLRSHDLKACDMLSGECVRVTGSFTAYNASVLYLCMMPLSSFVDVVVAAGQ